MYIIKIINVKFKFWLKKIFETVKRNGQIIFKIFISMDNELIERINNTKTLFELKEKYKIKIN